MEDVGVGVDCFTTTSLNEATPTDLPSGMMVASLNCHHPPLHLRRMCLFSLFDENKNPWDGQFLPRIDEYTGSDNDHSALSNPWIIQIIIPQVCFCFF